MKMSNQGQYDKARKMYGGDFNKDTSSADSGLKKGAPTMFKEGVAVSRFATGGAAKMTYAAKGGAPKPRHSMKEDAADMAADKISARKRGMSVKDFEGSAADERMDKAGSKPMRRGGKMGMTAADMLAERMAARRGAGRGIARAQQASEAEMAVPGMMKKGGVPRNKMARHMDAPVKRAMGGVGKQRHGAADKAGKPVKPMKTTGVI